MSTDPVESSRGTGRARSEAAGSARQTGAAGPVQGPTQGPTQGPRTNYGRDALGLVLLLLACFFGVAVVMAYVDPKEQASGMTGLVMALVDTLGASAMFLAAGLGWIGFRLWIRGVDGKVGRDLLGVVITTFTLAILVGALSPELGGRVGSVGAMVSSRLTVFVGLIFGVIVVLLPAWFLWLRPAALAAGELPRTSAPLSPRASDSSGVSQAEAEGLFPKSAARPPSVRLSGAPAVRADAAAQGVPAAGPFASHPAESGTSASAPSGSTPSARGPARRDAVSDTAKLASTKVVAPSPYPPDVRREGRVPEGARPLDSASSSATPARVTPPPAAPPAPPSHVPQPRPEPLPAQVPRDAAAVRARAAADAGVAGGAAELRRGVQPPVADEDAGQRGAAHELAPGSAVGRPGVAAGGDAPNAALTQSLERDSFDEPQTYADALASASAVAEPSLAQPLDRTPPKPSWEQPELFEEPVDSYGTPLSLVEKLRAQTEPAPVVAAAAAAADTASWSEEELGDEVFEASVKPLAAVEPSTDRSAPEVVIDIVFEAEAPAERTAEPAVELAAESVAEPAAESLASVAAEDSRESLREGLRGFIDLRERSSEFSEASATVAAAPERTAQAERTVSPVERAPVVSADEAPTAEVDVTSKSVGEELVEQLERPVLHLEAPSHASARPAVVIRSLFEEESAPSASAPPAVEAVHSPAAEPEPETAPESGAEAPGSAADVVLEPARRSKRKAKAQRAESAASDAAPSEAEPRARVEISLEPANVVDDAPREEPAPAMAAQEPSASEPEVELTPARPRSRSRVNVDEVVFKAGCLFVERQRVAVSMLQREFGLDFDAATSVLDQLQRVGLIGPYLGGQRRDILMTMDEWQELVGVE